MRKLYFVSVNGFDWVNMDTGSERIARDKASEMYPQGVYGSVYIGLLDGDDSVRRVLIRSPKVNEQKIYWRRYYTPTDKRAIDRAVIWGETFWLSVDGSESLMLRSNSIRSAKQAALRSPLLHRGARVEIHSQAKGSTELKLTAMGECDDKNNVVWQRFVLNNVNHISQ